MNSRLPHLRTVLAPEYASFRDTELRAELAAVLGPEISPEDLEFSLSDIGSAFKKVGSVVAKHAPAVLSGVAKGAAAGSAFGPYGALAGALLTGVSSGLQSASPSNSTASKVGSVLGSVTSLAGLATGGGRGGGLTSLAGLATGGGRGGGLTSLAGLATGGGRGGSVLGGLTSLAGLATGGGRGGGASASSATQLLGLLSRPEVRQAVTAMTLGRMGRESVPVATPAGPVEIPVQAFADLLQVALSRLDNTPASEAAEYADPTDLSTARAELLAELLAESVPVPRSWPRIGRARPPAYESEAVEWAEQMLREDAEYDALELLDLESEDEALEFLDLEMWTAEELGDYP